MCLSTRGPGRDTARGPGGDALHAIERRRENDACSPRMYWRFGRARQGWPLFALGFTPVSASTTIHEIKTLVQSRHPVVVLETVEEERVRGIVLAVAVQLGLPVFEWSVTQGLRRASATAPPSGITAEPGKVLAHIADMTVEGIFLLQDLHLHLGDAVTQRLFRDAAARLSHTRATMVLTGAQIELPAAIEADAVRVRVALPDAGELRAVVDAVIRSTGAIAEPVVRQRVVSAMQGLTVNQARQAVMAAVVNGSLDAADVADVQDRKVRAIAEGGLLEYFPADDNTFQLAGMANLKAWLERAEIAMGPEARTLNIPLPKGILLAGVPGCGKSLAAKFIARQWGRPLLKLDAGSLYDKYIGESERNLRAALEMAESLAPIVLWIDEIEKGLAVGGDDAGGAVGRRILGTFLTWMQEKRDDIFVVATSNDLTILPPELQRKGRFDEVFFVDLPTPDERAAILEIHLRLRRQPLGRFDPRALIAASDGFSGAEIEQVVVAGLLRALHAKAEPGTDALLAEFAATVPLSRSRPDAVAAVRHGSRDFVPVS